MKFKIGDIVRLIDKEKAPLSRYSSTSEIRDTEYGVISGICDGLPLYRMYVNFYSSAGTVHTHNVYIKPYETMAGDKYDLEIEIHPIYDIQSITSNLDKLERSLK